MRSSRCTRGSLAVGRARSASAVGAPRLNSAREAGPANALRAKEWLLLVPLYERWHEPVPTCRRPVPVCGADTCGHRRVLSPSRVRIRFPATSRTGCSRRFAHIGFGPSSDSSSRRWRRPLASRRSGSCPRRSSPSRSHMPRPAPSSSSGRTRRSHTLLPIRISASIRRARTPSPTWSRVRRWRSTSRTPRAFPSQGSGSWGQSGLSSNERRRGPTVRNAPARSLLRTTLTTSPSTFKRKHRRGPRSSTSKPRHPQRRSQPGSRPLFSLV